MKPESSKHLNNACAMGLSVFVLSCGGEQADLGSISARLTAGERIASQKGFRHVGPALNRHNRTNDANEIGVMQVPERPWSEFSIEELAIALRGRAIYDGEEYEEIDATPRAIAVFNQYHGKPVPSRIRAVNGHTPMDDGDTESKAETQPSNSKQVVGGQDTRTVRVNTGSPGSRAVLLSHALPITATTPSNCTASLIGARTALSSAHCFWNPDTDSWHAPYSWAPGFDSQDPDIDPFGQGRECYWATVPGAYQTANGSPVQHDYAVIDFLCDRPGDAAGHFWLRYPEYTFDEIANTNSLYGYPEFGSCGVSGAQCKTRVWGSENQATPFAAGYVAHSIDATGGQSGAPIFKYLSVYGGYYQVAIHKGDYGGNANWGKTIDSVVNFAIDDWSTEFP